MLRLDAAAFGAPREAVCAALEAEGVPVSTGYGFSLPAQPVFRNNAFGPYLPGARARLDYTRVQCPVSDRLCRESLWLGQELMLGSREDMDDIVASFEKVHAHRDALSERAQSI
jgi:hypothetical protein